MVAVYWGPRSGLQYAAKGQKEGHINGLTGWPCNDRGGRGGRNQPSLLSVISAPHD